MIRALSRALPALLILPSTAVSAPGAAGPQRSQAREGLFAVRAGELILGDGQRVAGGVLLVEGGRIRAAGRGVEIPAGTPVVEHAGVVAPGMIGCRGFSGSAGEETDPTRSVLPSARMADGFRPDHTDFERAREAGITALVLSPSAGNLVGGLSAVVKTAGGAVLREEAHLALSLTSDALLPNRYPTSLPGALRELDSRLERPSGPFAQARGGELPVLIAVDTRDEVARALEFAGRYRLQGSLAGAPLAGELAAEVKRSGLGVVVGPFAAGAPRRALRSVIALSEAEVPIAFAVEAPTFDPESLRFSVALCVREGLDPSAAWRALTADAARLAGVGERTGRLERGLDADFVLWSGDPLDLSSRVVAVYVDGRRAGGGAR